MKAESLGISPSVAEVAASQAAVRTATKAEATHIPRILKTLSLEHLEVSRHEILIALDEVKRRRIDLKHH